MRRDRQRPLKVWVSPEEREEIDERAKSTGLSISAFLRSAALGLRPRSVYDLGAVHELAKAGADLARLGGLLKLRLATRTEEGSGSDEVDHLLTQIRGMQQHMLQLMKRV